MNILLMAPFIVEDVRKALESIGDLKAPGLDGMPAIFYKRFWGTVGETVVQEVLDVLQGGELPEITHKVQKKLTKSFTQSMDYIHGVCAEYTGDGSISVWPSLPISNHLKETG